MLTVNPLVQLAIDNLGKDVSLTYMSQVKLTGGKKNEQQGLVTKVTRDLPVTLTVEGAYTAARNDARTDAGVTEQFVPKARAWGKRNEQGLIEHNGELYVEFIVNGKGTTEYLLSGEPIEKENIIGLPVTAPAEVTDGVIIRSIKIANLISIS